MYRLSARQVTILFTADVMCRKSPYFSPSGLLRKMLLFNTRYFMADLDIELKYLTQCGYLIRVKSKSRFHVNKYAITLDGKNELTEIEKRLRQERVDK